VNQIIADNFRSQLQRFANAARQLSSSAGILSSASELRRRLIDVAFLLRENAADLFPNEVQRYQSGADRSTPFGPAATPGLTPEDIPRKLKALAEDIMTFLSSLTEFPEFTDESLNGSILSFQGDLKVCQATLR